MKIKKIIPIPKIGKHEKIRKLKFHLVTEDRYFTEGLYNYLEEKQIEINLNNAKKIDISIELHKNWVSIKKIETKNDKTINIIIAEKSNIDLIGLIIANKENQFIFLISKSKCNQKQLNKIIEKENFITFSFLNLPNFILIGSLNKRDKRLCYYFYLGYPLKLIGMLMGVTEKTISNYRILIMKK